MLTNYAKKYIIDTIESCDTFYISTINLNNYPKTRALVNLRNFSIYPQYKELFDSNSLDLYFNTSSSSPKIKHIEKNNRVSFYYSNPSTYGTVSLFGRVEIVKDKKLKDSFWMENSDWNMYYPEGKDGKNYCIAKFIAGSYKFYDDKFNL